MNRPSVRVLALAAMIAVLAVAFPALGGGQSTASAETVLCADQSLAPVLTGYGVMSQTACHGPVVHGVVWTCNQIFGTWNGTSAWVPSRSGNNPCSSNGPLLDFGPCAPGTWRYRTFTVLDGAYGFIGVRLSSEVSIRC